MNTITTVVFISSQVLYGADMALRDNDGYTPLHLAAREGHVDAFKEMLRKGTENCKTLASNVASFGLVNKLEG